MSPNSLSPSLCTLPIRSAVGDFRSSGAGARLYTLARNCIVSDVLPFSRPKVVATMSASAYFTSLIQLSKSETVEDLRYLDRSRA